MTAAIAAVVPLPAPTAAVAPAATALCAPADVAAAFQSGAEPPLLSPAGTGRPSLVSRHSDQYDANRVK